MDVVLVLAIALILGLTIAVIATAADRTARRRAWRRIAVERRWNRRRYQQRP